MSWVLRLFVSWVPKAISVVSAYVVARFAVSAITGFGLSL